jgi:hypothetical protein
MADQSDEAPNPLVIEAFKPVIDAAIEFALLDDARRDGLDYLGSPNPDQHDRKVLSRAEAELLADYAEARVSAETEGSAHRRSLAALSEIVAGVAYLNGVFDVLRERCRRES